MPPHPSYNLILEGEQISLTTTQHQSFFDPRYLIAALLHHVALGDGEVCDEESRVMVDTISAYFGLDAGGAEQKLNHALRLYVQNMDLEIVGGILSQILEPAEREDVMLMLLQVAAADGRQGVDELRAVDEVAAVLNISPEQRHSAFQRYFSRQSDQ